MTAPIAHFHRQRCSASASIPLRVLTIENQTTFHAQARSRCDEEGLILYTAGMPSPAWRQMYVRLLRELPGSAAVAHWGDFDEGGFRISAFLARAAAEAGKKLVALSMHPDDINPSQRRPATDRTIERMVAFASRPAGMRSRRRSAAPASSRNKKAKQRRPSMPQLPKVSSMA